MILQRLFSSKAQKARRRAYDLQQGSTAKYANIKPLFGFNGPSNEEILANAQSQDKMIGRKKTMDLIKKGEDSIVGSSNGIMGKTISYDAAKVKNKKELDEIKRARDLLRAGRRRNRDRKFKDLYEGKKDNVNDIINKKEAGNIPYKWDRKDAIKQSRREARAAKGAGERLKKGGKIALAVGGTVAAGIGAKKLVDKKKAKKDSKERVFSEKKEKIHKKSNAVYAAGVGTGAVGSGILGKITGEAKGIKKATEEYLRGTDSYKEGIKQEKEVSEFAKELKKDVKNYQKKVLNSKNIKLKDKAKILLDLEKNKRDINKTYNSLKNSTEKAVKKVGNSEAIKHLKGSKKGLALGVGASAVGAGLIGKSVKMRKDEDLKAKKDDSSKK